jgi:hypothetical protein
MPMLVAMSLWFETNHKSSERSASAWDLLQNVEKGISMALVTPEPVGAGSEDESPGIPPLGNVMGKCPPQAHEPDEPSPTKNIRKRPENVPSVPGFPAMCLWFETNHKSRERSASAWGMLRNVEKGMSLALVTPEPVGAGSEDESPGIPPLGNVMGKCPPQAHEPDEPSPTENIRKRPVCPRFPPKKKRKPMVGAETCPPGWRTRLSPPSTWQLLHLPTNFST